MTLFPLCLSETSNYRQRSKYDQVRRTANAISLWELDSALLIYFAALIDFPLFLLQEAQFTFKCHPLSYPICVYLTE